MQGCDSGWCHNDNHAQAEPRSRVTSRIAVSHCRSCRTLTWWADEVRADPWDALATAFGEARVIDRLPGVAAPGTEVLVCRQPPGTSTSWLPARTWLEAAPDLFVARDGRQLLISSPSVDLRAVFGDRPSTTRPALCPA